MKHSLHARLSAVLGAFALAAAACVPSARGEAILQCFNLSHNEIAHRIPEIAEAGYSALWVPPVCKANGGMSVGYDCYDPFDIGNSDLRGQYSTRYGTQADLINLIEVAHRFGMRVYFDNVMNHRAYDVPGYNESTPTDVYPGMVAEDFHLRKTSDGFYRKWDNIDWGNFTEWDVMFRPLSDLIDIAQEPYWGDTDGDGNYETAFNGNFGENMGDWHPKPCIVRWGYKREQTGNLFDRMPWPGKSDSDYVRGGGAMQQTSDTDGVNLYVGFGNSRAAEAITDDMKNQYADWFRENDAYHGISPTLISNFPNFYSEYVEQYLCRAIRWLVDVSKVDGLRLDAVKHVRYDFFGATGEGSDASDYGYTGAAQWQFNMTRGFSDWGNHRDSVFSNDGPRDDLMMFGEHLGSPPDTGGYIAAGMRLVDDDLRNGLNSALETPDLWDYDWPQPKGKGFGPNCGVMHAQSHDNDYVAYGRKPLAHAWYYMRSGLGLVYTDGNNRAATLGGSGGAFPRWAQTDYLGQWHESQIPTLLKAHENFAMYEDRGMGSGQEYCGWERGGEFPFNRCLFMLNSAWDYGKDTWTGGTFPQTAGEGGSGGDAYLYNYASTYPGYMTRSTDGNNTEMPYAWASTLASAGVYLPARSYAIWNYKNPDPSEYWAAAVRAADYAAGCTNTSNSGLSDVITVYDNGEVAPSCGVVRTDGREGDPDFNPNGVEDDDPTDYSYTMAIPVVRGTNVTFDIHLDGEAEHVMARLDGGMDFGNGKVWWFDREKDEKDLRDHPPGIARDCELGFEDVENYFVRRIWAEVFASTIVTNTEHGCVLKSGDATTYEVAIGGDPVVWTNSHGIAFDTTYGNPSWLYHDPRGTADILVSASPLASRPGTSSVSSRAAKKASAKSADTSLTTNTYTLNATAAPGGSGVSGFSAITTVGNHYQDETTCWAGWFADGSCASADLTGFASGTSYGLYANPAGSSANAEVGGTFSEAAGLTSVSVVLGFNWDSDSESSYKGFAFLDADGNDIFGLNQSKGNAINYYGAAGGTWSSDYGKQAFTVTLTKTSTGYTVTGTTRTGGTVSAIALETGATIVRWKAYMNAAENGDNAKYRQLYFNDLSYTAVVTEGGGDDPDPDPPSPSDNSRATWIGKSYVNVNGTWYTGSGRDAEDPDAWWPDAGNFNGKNLGRLPSLSIGGQAQTYEESDGENHPAHISWNLLSGNDIVATGTNTLAWYVYTNRNNYFQSGGNDFALTDIDISGLDDGTYKLSVWFWAEGANGPVYDNNGGSNYEATFRIGEGGGGGGGGTTETVPQFSLVNGAPVVYAKMAKGADQATWLYYTTDGGWPNGCDGKSPARNVSVVEGRWVCNDADDTGSWWRFELPALATGTVLKYKIGGAYLQGDANGWETVWPGGPGAIDKKTKITGYWSIPNLDLAHLWHLKHNDYNSWTEGLDEGFHLFTVRCWPHRDNGSEIYNTFRQTFYMDRETPRGRLLYPQESDTSIGGSSYGCVLQTDRTVQKVYYHITDSRVANDGPGNGLTTNGVVEWAEAIEASPWTEDMATNNALSKVWKFDYNGIAASNNATIRVRLWEWSSAPTNQWNQSDPALDDPAALHVTEIVRTLRAEGDNEYVRFTWPKEGETVQAGWDVWLAYTAKLMHDRDDAAIFANARLYVNATNEAIDESDFFVTADDLVETTWGNHHWDWGGDGTGENTMSFAMPNVYNTNIAKYYMAVLLTGTDGTTVSNGIVIRHEGPLVPACVIATPPETDSDGIKYIIELPDVSDAYLATNPAAHRTPIVVHSDAATTNVAIEFASPAGYAGDVSLLHAETNGSASTWTFAWTVDEPGAYAFRATVSADTNRNTALTVPTNSAFRNATVQFRQLADNLSTNDLDWDDDGILNTNENTQLDTSNWSANAELWTQEMVFSLAISGKTDDKSPDTDGDGLPDGLELGLRWPENGEMTDLAADFNGDGEPNFAADLDPPFYNTIDNLDSGRFPTGVISTREAGGDRKAMVVGSVTDPNNADTDYDGLPDGVEDANRNGWTDGDGQALPPSWDPWSDRALPDGVIDSGETWEETSPCVADSDKDGLSDGWGEDVNFNGRTDLYLLAANGTRTALTNGYSIAADGHPASRAIDYAKLFADYAVDGTYAGAKQSGGWPRLLVTETDPLKSDTDGDGLPDGWERQYGLDPLDNGTYNFATGEAGNPENGADGNPDGDTMVDGEGHTIPYTNAREYAANTNPRKDDTVGGGGEGEIEIGGGEVIGTVNDTTYYREFLDWTLDDLIALDDYNQGGNSADIRRRGDGYDSSRDMVAFYFRDGGAAGDAGGDGRLYFRVDFDDLMAFAEESSLNIFVAINFGNYGRGEYNLPEDVDIGSAMGWQAVLAVYDSSNGSVYLDKDPNNNTTAVGGDLAAAGVVNEPDGFKGAYFNSELDAVAWSIDRKKLTDLGWNGNPDGLKFQVYTTLDYTEAGSNGDMGGINDFTDTIGDDWLCSDYWNDRNNIIANGVYRTSVGRTSDEHTWNNRGNHAKLSMLSHGNQALEPGSTIQNIVNNGAGAGYFRPVAIHNIYTNCPLTLHITPTLAQALQWAEVGTDKTWFSGPALNAQIASGVANGNIMLLGSTYSDHIPRYFDDAFNTGNVALANEVLNTIYGGSPTNRIVSTNVFWCPERIMDEDTLHWVAGMGYKATLLDQTPHLLEWFGREYALGDNGYKIQRFWLTDHEEEMKAFVLSTAANQFRYVNTDSGLPNDLRHLFLRRARSGQAVISSIFYMWEELSQSANADAYDKSLRWIANHPWIQVVTLDEAIADERLNGNYAYSDVGRGKALVAHDWVQHACSENYDNWYYGSSRHESLADKKFEVTEGNHIASAYGSMAGGILSNTWATVRRLANADVKRLAEETLYASVFETAFHTENNDNLTRWSYGDYVYPARDWQGLQGFAWRAQSRTRLANVFSKVDDWAGRTLRAVEVSKGDFDLDGQDEYFLANNAVAALFDVNGGLMVGAWCKDGTNVYQMVGNFTAIPENGYETEGAYDTDGAAVTAQRGSSLRDISVAGAPLVGNVYTVATNANGLSLASGGLTKTVSLASAATNAFDIGYSAGSSPLYVRMGLSPDLVGLMRSGQAHLVETAEGTGRLALATVRPDRGTQAEAVLSVATGSINAAASDKGGNDFNTVDMRNRAQTRQVEVMGTGSIAMQLAFTVETSSFEPPVIHVSPDDNPQIFVAGATNRFTVTVTDPDSADVALSVGDLPAGGYHAPAFDAATGVFAWHVAGLSEGERVEDYRTSVTFTATDGVNTTNRTVEIVVPWDSDGDGMGDDWELKMFGDLSHDGTVDSDRDGMTDWAEYIAGTRPKNDEDFLGWDSIFEDGAGGTILTFDSVAGRTYEIQAVDGGAGLLAPQEWTTVSDRIQATSAKTSWTDETTNAVRMYRIKVVP